MKFKNNTTMRRSFDLKESIIKKVAKQVLQNKLPLIISTPNKQEAKLKEFEAELKTGFDFKVHRHTYGHNTYISADFQINLKTKHIGNVHLSLKFKDNELHLAKRYGDAIAYPTHAEEVKSYARALQEAAIEEDARYGIKVNEVVKKDKINALKKAAIVAKIKEVVKSYKNNYTIDDSYATKIKLILDLSDKLYMEVDIPYSNFQAVLENLNETVQSVTKLIDKGIMLKIKSV